MKSPWRKERSSWLLLLRRSRPRIRTACVILYRNARACSLRDHLLLERIRLASGHREDGAMQSALRVAILDRERIDLRTEQAQESAAPVRRKHGERPNRSAKHALAVISCNNILNGMEWHIGFRIGACKLEVAAFEGEPSC